MFLIFFRDCVRNCCSTYRRACVLLFACSLVVVVHQVQGGLLVFGPLANVLRAAVVGLCFSFSTTGRRCRRRRPTGFLVQRCTQIRFRRGPRRHRHRIVVRLVVHVDGAARTVPGTLRHQFFKLFAPLDRRGRAASNGRSPYHNVINNGSQETKGQKVRR